MPVLALRTRDILSIGSQYISGSMGALSNILKKLDR